MRISFAKADLDSKPFESSKNQASSTSSYQHRGYDTPQNYDTYWVMILLLQFYSRIFLVRVIF